VWSPHEKGTRLRAKYHARDDRRGQRPPPGGSRAIAYGGGHRVTGTGDTADKLLTLVANDEPDAAIVDIRLPPTHTDEGMKATLAIRADHPDVGVVVLSQYVEVGLAMQLLGDSAEGPATC
jgi:DNA-binding NarL/FixJ family response regulator